MPRSYYDFILNESLDVLILEHNEPSTYNQAMMGPDSIKWLEAMRSEMDSMVENQFSGSKVTFLVLYVDDILLIGNENPMLKSVTEWLEKRFSMKDLGNAEFKMQDSKRGFLSIQHGIYHSKTQCPKTPIELDKMTKITYASAIGSIIFKSQLGYVFILNGGVISCKRSKKDIVADSTIEVEYIAASEVTKEAVWIRKFLNELSVVHNILKPIDIYCDNNGAITQTKEPNPLRNHMPRPKHESHTRAKGLKHIGE
ncbi:uncharacterized protein LOC124924351 [Impatiens glandulifera]|uniref:uncharacterized protein LOC124924351 n=1 Tax=Impatiens glandulifera TaxID=253017 RepID=UPI001FB0B5FE|nr:uncharacterized protein LOC124924351 [Impatiens glandulifera]